MAGKGKGKARKRKRTPPPNPNLYEGDDDVAAGPSRPAQYSTPSTSRLEGEEGGAKATPNKIPARAGGGTQVTPHQYRLNDEARATSSTTRYNRESARPADVRPTEPYNHPDGLPYGEEVEMATSRSPSPELRPRRGRRAEFRRDDSPPYRHAPSSEQDSDSNEPWMYNPITQLVCHTRCPICTPYSNHYMAAATSLDRSLHHATDRQHEASSAQIRNDLLRAELEIEALNREKKYYRDLCFKLEADIERCDEHGKRKRPRRSEASSTSRDADRRMERRTDMPPPSAPVPAQRSNPVREQDVNMHDIIEELDPREYPQLPAPAEPNQPVHTRPWIDNLGVQRLPSGERDHSVGLPRSVFYSPVDNTVRAGAAADRAHANAHMAIPPPRGTWPASERGLPTNVPSWTQLLKAAKGGDPDATDLAKAFVMQASNLQGPACTPAHLAALRQWHPNRWRPGSTKKAAAQTAQRPRSNDTGSTQTRNPASSSVQAPGPSQQGGSSNRPPTMQDDDQTWARFFNRVWSNPASRRAGILVETDGSVSLRHVRGSRLISQFTPRRGAIDQEQNRSAYTRTAMELVAMPGSYRHILQTQGILVAQPPVEPRRYDRPLANISVGDVASFFASQGITLAQVDDAWAFALLWLRETVRDPAEAEELFEEIDSVIMYNNVEPPSINTNPEDDWWRPPGYTAPQLPASSNDHATARTHESSTNQTHRAPLSPASPPPSAGGRSDSEASSSPRRSPRERPTQLPAPPYSGAGSAGALPHSVAPSADVTHQLQGLGVSTDTRGNTPPPQYAPHPGGGANPTIASTSTVPADVPSAEDVEMSQDPPSA